jgi:glutamine synthetase
MNSQGPASHSSIGAAPEEAERFLAAHPGIAGIDLILTDPGGVMRGKNIRREELLAIYRHGRYMPGSILSLDITGEDVEETNLVWVDGDADRLCHPVPGTLLPAPWRAEEPTGQVILTMHELDGRPYHADPRHALERVVKRFTDQGLTPVMAVELEFYLLDPKPGPDGRPRPALTPGSGHRPRHIEVYDVNLLGEMWPVFAEIHACAKAQGLPAQTVIHEYSPGQWEITLHHRADAMRAVDEGLMFKRLIRGVAAKHGMQACFMAKPFAGRAGSGMHIHLSLADKDGNNLFADGDKPEGSTLLRHTIGGMAATMADAMLVYAPNANSYRRFRRTSYAPVAPTWGINNRSVGLRIPAGPGASRHIEHRPSGADANPYLAVAMALAGAHYGIERKIDPGPPITGNGYEQAKPGALPQHWSEAIERAERSAFLKEYLGKDFFEVFLAIKRAELDRFMAEVTELDYQWYLRTT